MSFPPQRLHAIPIRTQAAAGLRAAAPLAAALLAGCSGPQSSLDPAGLGAEWIAGLFWWMTAGAILVWLATLGLAFAVARPRPLPKAGSRSRRAGWLIIGGGAILPTIVLTALLGYGLAMLPGLVAPAPPGSLRIAVTGEQWWWRVRYQLPDGDTVALANELRLPVGEPVEFVLDSADVIHSFWIPSLGGKMDMIPGRTTRLALWPTRTGKFRGVCAEYCGASHALMAFDVVVMERDAFADWLQRQRQPAARPAEPLVAQGRDAFFANGCPACHTVRGSRADGVIGPDLTHVGSRLSLAAGTLPNNPGAFARWVARTDRIKPAVQMPHFGMLPPEDLRALAAYLESLE